MAKILGLFFVACVCTSSAWADEAADRKQELAKLKNQAQKKEAELRKYREQEKKISKEISALQNQQAQAEKMKNRAIFFVLKSLKAFRPIVSAKEADCFFSSLHSGSVKQ